MQVSPELREASDFAGRWTITGGAEACEVTLLVDRVESANAYALSDGAGCLELLLGKPADGWRPATDGIDFAGRDRLSIGFFSFEGEAAILTRPGIRLVLTRTD